MNDQPKPRVRQVVMPSGVYEILAGDIVDSRDLNALARVAVNGWPGHPAEHQVPDVSFFALKHDGDDVRIYVQSETFEPLGCCWGRAPEHPAPHLEVLRSAATGHDVPSEGA